MTDLHDRVNDLNIEMADVKELSFLVLEIGEIANKAQETADRVEARLEFLIKGNHLELPAKKDAKSNLYL